MRNVFFVVTMVLSLAFYGCAATKVERIKSEETVDLSGGWNDSDSRMVADKMIGQSLGEPWLKKFKSEHRGKAPVVIVGAIANLSHEHISVGTFVKNMERALINSGEVEFVASSSERGEVREERKDQATHSSEETAKGEGEETGADFMMKGSINSILDKLEGKSVVYYQVNLELIDIRTHKKVWIGEEKIKKFVTRSRFGL
ncbi:MAG TPA: penicillin-binding protein activator LpoB [Thermodesulfobacteriota bacterium]|nr:penicillin-binding protein activator LpoB [Thermodesulfobacteriota bacterium]